MARLGLGRQAVLRVAATPIVRSKLTAQLARQDAGPRWPAGSARSWRPAARCGVRTSLTNRPRTALR